MRTIYKEWNSFEKKYFFTGPAVFQKTKYITYHSIIISENGHPTSSQHNARNT